MSQIVKNNGNGHHGQQLQTRAASGRREVVGNPAGVKENSVTFQTADGSELRGVLVRLTRHTGFFELHNPGIVPRFSEALDEFKILFQERTIYSGRAVVRNLVNMGSTVVCEATLNEAHWRDVVVGLNTVHDGKLVKEFGAFLEEWQKLYKVLPEFKVVVADMQTFWTDLRLWLDQIELQIRASPSDAWTQLERKVIDSLAESTIQAIDAFIERFESIADKLDDDLQPVHRLYLRRQLHPLVFSSPFAYRSFHKPLGYAGDYQVVDMMIRPPYEGATLFAKIINVWLLRQSPAQAHRNRIAYLERKLVEETTYARAQGRVARVFNLGCGPAAEVQQFLKERHICEQVDFTLMDFNQETLDHLNKTIRNIVEKRELKVSIQLIKKSVHQFLKESERSAQHGQYDFIYCAGLFDYLPDQVCKQLMNVFYDKLASNGLLLATNASDVLNDSKPFHYSMEYFLDWHLKYRTGHQLKSVAPDQANPDDVTVIAENTGTNIFLEVRKRNA